MHGYSNPLVGYAMVGWWTGTTSTFSSRMYYGVYIYHNSIQVRTAVTAGTGIHQLANNTNSVGTKWRLKIRLKAAGGAMMELFKDGDFTTPYGSYDYGTTGTLANLGFGVCQYRPGNSDIKLEQVAIGSQPATTTISGNGIQTGAIESTNWNNNNAGSRLNLIGGTLELGGATTSAKLYFDGTNLTLAGTVTATAGAIGGSVISSTSISSAGTSMPSPDSAPYLQLTNEGEMSGSALYIRQVANLGSGNELIPLIDTQQGLIDGRNMGRQVVSSYDEYVRGNSHDASLGTGTVMDQFYFALLPYETHLVVEFSAKSTSDSSGATTRGTVNITFEYMDKTGTSNTSSDWESWIYTSTGALASSGTLIASGNATRIGNFNGTNARVLTLPPSYHNKVIRCSVRLHCRMSNGATISLGRNIRLKGLSVIATRRLSAATSGQTAINLDSKT